MTDRKLLDALPPEIKAKLRKIAQPRWVAPMLATLTDQRFSREGWLFEPKWDGERCLALRRGHDLSLCLLRTPNRRKRIEIFASAPYRRGMITILSALASLLSFRVRR